MPAVLPREVDLLADLDLLDRQARAGRLQDLERGGHDLRADAVAVGDGDGDWVRHVARGGRVSPGRLSGSH